MCMWNDNGAVTVGSNFECVYPMDSARRWSTEKKAYVVVGRTHLIRSYNQNMGGTDQMDQAIACYRPNIRNRKWYWPLFSYIIQIGCYNSWMLFHKLNEDVTFLTHIRSIIRSYLRQYRYEKHVVPKTSIVFHSSRISKRVNESVRYDGKNHFIGSEKEDRKSMCIVWKDYCEEMYEM